MKVTIELSKEEAKRIMDSGLVYFLKTTVLEVTDVEFNSWDDRAKIIAKTPEVKETHLVIPPAPEVPIGHGNNEPTGQLVDGVEF